MMRRRPLEFWWIGLLSMMLALQAAAPVAHASSFDRTIISGYAAAFVLSWLLLFFYAPLGRSGMLVLLAAEGCARLHTLICGALDFQQIVYHATVLCICGWLVFYLQSPSTRRLCRGIGKAPRIKGTLLGFGPVDLFEFLLVFSAGWIAMRLNTSFELAFSCAVGVYLFYGVLLEDWLRVRLAGWLLAPKAFSPADAGHLRRATAALAAGKYQDARRHVTLLALPSHPDAVLLIRAIDWNLCMTDAPADGAGGLRRVIYDHEWHPNAAERNLIDDYIQAASEETVRKMVEARAELLELLIGAALDTNSLLHHHADRMLSRLTGETYVFNPCESWAAWWQNHRADWSGDAGGVALVARLLNQDAVGAAHTLAKRVSGRAEEPNLKELTAQVLFLTQMQGALRSKDGVESFVRQPQRMLLYPELSDAVGLLHADSQLLEHLGMNMNQVVRRLQLRVTLIDYIGRLWNRYPQELNADMPWLIQVLTGKNLGVLRARARFRVWWPAVRESYVRHDKAMAAGLTAFGKGDDATAEKYFREAMAENPRELSSRYNVALCVLKRKAHEEAARLLLELTRLEPKEPFWWMQLGEIHRSINKPDEAVAAFRKALELGYAPPKVALHMGLTLASNRRDEEAKKHLDRVLGPEPSAAKVDWLVSELENEGLWKLAGHYREEAFRRGLSSGFKDSDEFNGEDDLLMS